MQFVATLPEYADDLASSTTWGALDAHLHDVEGVAFYKHPVIKTASGAVPDLTVLPRGFEPLTVRCLPYRLDELADCGDQTWTLLSGTTLESPFVLLEDFVYALRARLESQRDLRRALHPQAVVSLPNMSRVDFFRKYPHLERGDLHFIFQDLDTSAALTRTKPLSESQWNSALSVVQNALPLQRTPLSTLPPEEGLTIGAAMRTVERDIALLDAEQVKVAHQMPPGPQRIRGLAGTGKTVLLAMKVANLHQHFPDKRILFTFWTQSLYSQLTRWIELFFRANAEAEPNWDKIHVQHAWGGATKPGVYSSLCRRQVAPRLDFNSARARSRSQPFRAACQDALSRPIEPYYDFALVDEAQDVPPEFFRMLYQMTHDPHAIYWAYDELQNLSSVETPGPSELFGNGPDGAPLVNLDGEYPGGIEKDLVLDRSYRCPRDVLMLAHALGLGIYGKACVQMLQSLASWRAIGYELESGELETGKPVVLFRPEEKSPNRVAKVYKGPQQLIGLAAFDSQEAECDWIAQSITNDIDKETVAPENIFVVALDTIRAKAFLGAIQQRLWLAGKNSLVAGVSDDSSVFARPGSVTLATTFRAKGNEAHVVYVANSEMLGKYAVEVDGRNRAFTAISRAKGFVRLTGSGPSMTPVQAEVHSILNDLPRFRFVFPDCAQLRRLDAETGRRKKEAQRLRRSALELLRAPKGALMTIDPELRKDLAAKIKEEE